MVLACNIPREGISSITSALVLDKGRLADVGWFLLCVLLLDLGPVEDLQELGRLGTHPEEQTRANKVM